MPLTLTFGIRTGDEVGDTLDDAAKWSEDDSTYDPADDNGSFASLPSQNTGVENNVNVDNDDNRNNKDGNHEDHDADTDGDIEGEDENDDDDSNEDDDGDVDKDDNGDSNNVDRLDDDLEAHLDMLEEELRGDHDSADNAETPGVDTAKTTGVESTGVEKTGVRGGTISDQFTKAAEQGLQAAGNNHPRPKRVQICPRHVEQHGTRINFYLTVRTQRRRDVFLVDGAHGR